MGVDLLLLRLQLKNVTTSFDDDTFTGLSFKGSIIVFTTEDGVS